MAEASKQFGIEVKNPAITAYIAGFILGGVVAILGVITPQIAVTYGVSVATIVQIDTLILIGLLAGNIISGPLIHKLGARYSLAISCLIMGVVWVILPFTSLIFFYGVCVFLSGLSMGLLLPVINYIVVHTYTDNGLADSKLNILNSYIGFGSCIGPVIAGYITFNYSWGTFVCAAGIVFLILVFYVFLIRFSKKITTVYEKDNSDEKGINGKKPSKKRPITKTVIFVGLALFMYIYVEYIISYWFTPYMAVSLKYNAKDVGFIIGCFWLAVAIGRYVLGGFVLPKVKRDYVFIIIAVICVIIGFFLFLQTENMALIYLVVIFLGFGCACLFPTLIGLGMKQTVMSPVTMAFLMGSASLGGIVSLIIAPAIGTMYSMKTAIYTAPIGCVLVIIFVIAVSYLRHKAKMSQEADK